MDIINREKVYSTLILFLLISFIFSYAINSICTFLFILFFIVDNKNNIVKKTRIIKSKKHVLFYIIFFLIQVFGLFYSEDIQTGFDKTIKFIPLMFLPLVIESEKLNKASFLCIVKILKYVVLVFFSVSLVFHCLVNDKTLLSFVTTVINDKLNISQFYIAYVIIIPILFVFNQIENKKNILLNVLEGIFLLFCLILLQNKTTFCIFILIVIIKFYSLRRRGGIKLKKRYVLSMVSVVVFLIFITYFSNLKNKFEVLIKTTDFDIETIITKNKVTHTKNTFEHRVLINYIVIKEVFKSLPLGVGTGDYLNIIYGKYEDFEFKEGILQKLNLHNQYFSEFLKTGLLGGSVFLVLIFFLLKLASLNDVFYIYLVLFFCIGCFFESYLERQHGVFIFSFLLPLTLKYEKIK